MPPTPYEKVPLTDDEKATLLDVFRVRRRFLFMVYFVLILMTLIYSPRGIDTYDRYTGNLAQRWEDKDDAKFLGRVGMWVINFSFLGGAVIATGLFFFYKRVYPLKKDADTGLKDKIPYEIIRKEYFPLTNQYYVALADPNYLHHEIDEDTYHNCTEGGFVYVYRAPRSKFVFEENGRFTIL